MRRTFADVLLERAKKDKRIFVIAVDLGYKLWDQFREELPDQFLNTGASEQSAMGIAVGLALSGKIPFIYSITPFLIYRPFETLRTYINYEKIPVKLVGGGRDKDYAHDGISHWAEDVPEILGTLKNIKQIYPKTAYEIQTWVDVMISNKAPTFISLER